MTDTAVDVFRCSLPADPASQAVLDNLRGVVPELRDARMLPGCGHWTQQERPDEVTETMISFLRGLG